MKFQFNKIIGSRFYNFAYYVFFYFWHFGLYLTFDGEEADEK